MTIKNKQYYSKTLERGLIILDLFDRDHQHRGLSEISRLTGINKSDGCAVAVDDDQILTAEEMLASREGTFVCPEGAANLSAAIKLREDGWIKAEEKVVLLNTGSGLKYPETVNFEPPVLEPGSVLTSVHP